MINCRVSCSGALVKEGFISDSNKIEYGDAHVLLVHVNQGYCSYQFYQEWHTDTSFTQRRNQDWCLIWLNHPFWHSRINFNRYFMKSWTLLFLGRLVMSVVMQQFQKLVQYCRHCRHHQNGNLHLSYSRLFSTSRVKCNVELTSKRYPNLKRGQYATLNDADLKLFESIMPGRVLTDISELDGYNTDWLKTCKG